MVHNIDGLPDPHRDPYSIKLDTLCYAVQRHHISVLLETKTNNMNRILQHMPGHAVYNTVVPDACVGLKGYGVAIFVDQSCKDFVRLHHFSEATQTIWLRCSKDLFGTAEDVMLGACYVNPQSASFPVDAITEHFTHLFHDVLDSSQVSPNLLLCGDFNARVGTLSEVSDAHYELLHFPEFLHERRCLCPHINKAGRLLVDIAAATNCAITTGRVKGDDGQPTYVGYSRERQSRPDHILLSPALYRLADRVCIKGVGHFDHHILSMVFRVDSVGSQHADTDLSSPYVGHQADGNACDVRLTWKPDKALHYSLHIQDNHVMKQQFQTAADSGDVEGAYCCLKQVVVQAANAPEVGMSSRSKFDSNRIIRRGMKRPVWFDKECQARRQALMAAVLSGQARHACKALQKANRSHARWARRRFTCHQRAVFLARLNSNDAAIHAMLKRGKGAHRTPITAAAWEKYLRDHFESTPNHQQQRARRSPHLEISARDMAVPLGRKHPPPELLLRQGKKSGWMKQPDVVDSPSVCALVELVRNRLAKMNAGASPGLDCIGPAFLKHACVPGVDSEGKLIRENVLAPLLARLFKLLVDKSCIPSEWKLAKLSPIHKKGPVLDPANYRTIAVSGTLYRLYTNVLCDLVTAWCKDRRKIPDSQFGFYPGRNTLQPMFILRHLQHAAQKLKPRGSPRLHVAFIDFKQAYDTVPRFKLWEHLERACMPSVFLSAIKGIYMGDEYILVDGEKRARVKPSRGVKQGCPLSPLLFSLYINDIDGLSEGIEGAITGDGVTRVTHMLYADDLCLCANEPSQLQTMLNRLAVYARSKHLVVNVGKSEVVHFNSRANSSSLPTFQIDGLPLISTSSFRYLGVVFTSTGNMVTAADAAVQPYMAAVRRVHEFAHSHLLQHRPHALLWLLKVYAFPAGMYGSQIWGTRYLQEGREFESQLQKLQLASLRRVLGVKKGVSNWALLRECGQEPAQLHWFRAAIKLFNAAVESNSATLRQVMKADLALSRSSDQCWSAQVIQGFKGMPSESDYSQQLLAASPIDADQLVNALRFRHESVWRVAEAEDPRVVLRKVTAYQHWFCVPFWPHPGKVKKKKKYLSLPSYLCMDMPRQVVRNVSRLRLRAHRLNVETCMWGGREQVASKCMCDKCGSGDVQDEKHILFYCSWSSACEVRRKYEDVFANLFAPLQWFARAQSFLPYLSYHLHKDSIGDEDVRWFLSQNRVRLCKCLSELLSAYDSH